MPYFICLIATAAVLLFAAGNCTAQPDADFDQVRQKANAFKALLKQSRQDSDAVLASLIKDASHVVGLELITSGPLKDRAESRWGHSLLRFVLDTGEPAEDPIVSFVIGMDQSDLTLIGVTLGGYPREISVSRLSDLIMLNLEGEGRSLFRLPILSDATSRSHLIATLERWHALPGKSGKYYLGWANCASGLFSLLSAAGLAVPRPFVTRPSQVAGALRCNQLAPLPEIEMPGLLSLLSSHMSAREAHEFMARHDDIWRANEMTLLHSLPTIELQRIYYALAPADFIRRKMKLIEILGKRSDLKPLSEAYVMDGLPTLLYQTCKNCDETEIASALDRVGPFKRDLTHQNIQNQQTALFCTFNALSPQAEAFRLIRRLVRQRETI